MPSSAEQIAGSIIAALEAAWNTADGAAFGRPFASNADFVTIRGEHFRGRETIAGGHQGIFDTIYRGSQVRYELLQVRILHPDVLLVHFKGTLNAPTGPLVGEHRALPSLVLVRTGDAWEIVSFHNTLMMQR